MTGNGQPGDPLDQIAEGDLRVRLAEVLNQLPLDLREFCLEALGASERKWVDVDCKACKNVLRYSLPHPTWSVRIKALQILLDQSFGKPAETKTVTAQVDVTKSLREMTDSELASLLAADPG